MHTQNITGTILLGAISGIMLFLPLSVFARVSDVVVEKKEPVYCPALSHLVVRGSVGAQVRELQRFLSDYYAVPLDTIQTGYFGRLTQEHVVRFQKEQGLPAFGIVGVMTRQKIAAVCGCGASGTCGLPPVSQSNSPKITITSLSAGEVVKAGQAVPIHWVWEPNGAVDNGVTHAFTASVFLVNADGKKVEAPAANDQTAARSIAYGEAKKNTARTPWVVGKDAWDMAFPITPGKYKLRVEVRESCTICDRAEPYVPNPTINDETDTWFVVE